MRYPAINKTFIPLSFSSTKNEIFRDEGDATTMFSYYGCLGENTSKDNYGGGKP